LAGASLTAETKGVPALREWINVFNSGNNGRSGYLNFNGRFTGQNALNPSATLGEADFMMGLPGDLGRGLRSGTWASGRQFGPHTSRSTGAPPTT
jgi:hypothetical protein